MPDSKPVRITLNGAAAEPVVSSTEPSKRRSRSRNNSRTRSLSREEKSNSRSPSVSFKQYLF